MKRTKLVAVATAIALSLIATGIRPGMASRALADAGGARIQSTSGLNAWLPESTPKPGGYPAAGQLPRNGVRVDQSSLVAAKKIPTSLARAIAGALSVRRDSGPTPASGFRKVTGGYAADDLNGGLQANFTHAGATVSLPTSATSWSLGIEPVSFGRVKLSKLKSVVPQFSGQRLRYRYHGLTAWFVIRAGGLEQGITVAQRPAGGRNSVVSINLGTTGSVSPVLTRGGQALRFVSGNQSVLTYGGLRATDAHGKALPAHLALSGASVHVIIQDRGAAYPVTVDPYFFSDEIVAPVARAGDESGGAFGCSVALSSGGGVAIVGADAVADSSGEFYAGAAYIFTRTDSAYVLAATLDDPGNAGRDFFGQSVALSGDGTVAIVGASGTNSGTGAGYIFRSNGSGYHQVAELNASDGASGDGFGDSVALSSDGSVAMSGAPGHNNWVGAAYIFDASGSSYSQTAELVDSDAAANDDLGTSVALSSDGDVALAGAWVRDQQTGAAFVFDRGTSGYSQVAELTASDGKPGDDFGVAVALSGSGVVALVGSPGHYDGPLSDGSGAAYIFTLTGQSYVQTAELTALDADGGCELGLNVALDADGGVAFAGGGLCGVDYIFAKSGSSYIQQQQLTQTDGGADTVFGGAGALTADGSTVLIGGEAQDGGTGAAYIFSPSGGATTMTMSSSTTAGSNAGLYGYPKTFTANVGPTSPQPTPSGPVQFWDGDPTDPASRDLGGSFISGGQVSLTTSSLQAGPHEIYALYGGDDNYAGSEGIIYTYVAPAPLSIAADDNTVIFAAPMPPITFTAKGFVNGDSASSLAAEPACTTTALEDASGDDTSPPGVYPITCSGAVDPNYTFKYVAGSLTVQPSDTLSYSGDTILADGTNGTISATLTAASSGDPLAGKTLTLSLAPRSAANQGCTTTTNSSGVASCALDPVIVAAGVTTVQMVFVGDSSYSANTQSVEVTVDPAPTDPLTYPDHRRSPTAVK